MVAKMMMYDGKGIGKGKGKAMDDHDDNRDDGYDDDVGHDERGDDVGRLRSTLTAIDGPYTTRTRRPAACQKMEQSLCISPRRA